MGCGTSLEGEGTRHAATAGSAVDITGTTEKGLAAQRIDMPRTGNQAPAAAPKPIEAATAERRARLTTTGRRPKAGSNSTIVATEP